MIGASEASIVLHVEILSVCLSVYHGPTRYSFFCNRDPLQTLREMLRMATCTRHSLDPRPLFSGYFLSSRPVKEATQDTATPTVLCTAG